MRRVDLEARQRVAERIDLVDTEGRDRVDAQLVAIAALPFEKARREMQRLPRHRNGVRVEVFGLVHDVIADAHLVLTTASCG